MSALIAAIVPALAWSLLDFVWQGLLIGASGALLLALLRRARPQTRYAIGCAALLLCISLPLAGTVTRVLDGQAPGTTSLLLAVLELPAEGSATMTGPAPAPMQATARLVSFERQLHTHLSLVILFWSAGAGLLALRMMLGLAWVRRRSQIGQYNSDQHWQGRLERLAQGFGIRRHVALGLVDDLSSPVTAGWWRPVVLVPASLVTSMPVGLLEALLAHELAHIRRHDYLVNLIQSAIEIVLFYHPAVWWLSNQIRIEREQIADDLAASMLGEPRRLALALSELDRFQFATPQLAQAAHGGHLMSRIKRLVRPDTEPLNWKMALPILGLAVAGAAFYVNAAPALAEPAPERRHITITKGDSEFAYALVRGPSRHASSMSGSSDDFDEVNALKRTMPGDFFWFRSGSKAYVVQDGAWLAKLAQAWKPVDVLGAQMEVHGKQMEAHGKVMEALGDQMQQAARSNRPDQAELRKVERNIEALAESQHKLGEEMDELGQKMAQASAPQRDALRQKIDALAAKISQLDGELSKQTDVLSKQIEALHIDEGQMEAIGAKMELAGKPMEAIGEKLEALGAQMELRSAVADKQVNALIKQALSSALAQPVPVRKAG